MDVGLGDLPKMSCEFIVVDNASHDQSVTMIREDFPWVQLIGNTANVGFAAANNQALALCQGEYTLLLNPDTRLKPGALARLVEFMQANPQAGIAGALLRNPDGSLQRSCSPRPTLFRELWFLLHLDILVPISVYPNGMLDSGKPVEVDVVQGAALMIRREILDEVGSLDADFFLYSEEVDLCFRVQKAGWRIYWVPQAEVIHYGGQSTQQVRAEMFIQLYRAKVQYFRKNQGRLAARSYKVALLLAAFVRLLLSLPAWLLNVAQRPHVRRMAGYYGRLLIVLPRL